MKKTGVLLINLGTPDSPSTSDVRRYLREFLNDPRVIDISPLRRFFLVNFIIVPTRAPKSAKLYKELWNMWNGESPLWSFGKKLKSLTQERFNGNNITVHFAMRYQNPSLESVLREMENAHYDRIVILPLFPHNASASTGSAIEKAMKIIGKWWSMPEISIVESFFDHPKYVAAFVEKAKKHNVAEFDHVIFSYHGLPERQIEKVHPNFKCADCNCPNEYNKEQNLCYRNQCYETSRLIAAQLNLPAEKYTVCFQSRLGKTPWLTPYSDHVVADLGKKGCKKILAFSPAFIADCLETSYEIGVEYQHLFEKAGGTKVQLVESLNDSKLWVDTVEELIRKRTATDKKNCQRL